MLKNPKLRVLFSILHMLHNTRCEYGSTRPAPPLRGYASYALHELRSLTIVLLLTLVAIVMIVTLVTIVMLVMKHCYMDTNISALMIGLTAHVFRVAERMRYKSYARDARDARAFFPP